MFYSKKIKKKKKIGQIFYIENYINPKKNYYETFNVKNKNSPCYPKCLLLFSTYTRIQNNCRVRMGILLCHMASIEE